MLARKSTHKRKRSSARADSARARPPARLIANVLPPTLSASDRQQASPSARADPKLVRLVEQHPFNHSLELILPYQPSKAGVATDDATDDATDAPPEAIEALIQRLSSLTGHDRAASYLAKVPLSLFLDPIFVTAYIKCGSLTALSLGRIDADDVVCLDGQGTLILSLTKDTYQTLGLTGRPSRFARLASGRAGDRQSGAAIRYIVELPLLSPSFVPGKKGYQQALNCLRRWDAARAARATMAQTLAETHLLGQIYAGSSAASSSRSAPSNGDDETRCKDATWDVLFSWTPSLEAEDEAETQGEGGLPTTINFPSHLVHPSTVKHIGNQNGAAEIVTDVWVPQLGGVGEPSGGFLGIERLGRGWNDKGKAKADPERLNWEEWQLMVQEVVEWLGLVSIGADIIKTYWRSDDFCVYAPPEPRVAGSVVKIQWRGFISSRLVSRVAAELERFLDGEASHPDAACAWASLSVCGFMDAPVSWRSKIPASSCYGSSATAQAEAKKSGGKGRDSEAKKKRTDLITGPMDVDPASVEEIEGGTDTDTDSGSDSSASFEFDAITASSRQTGKAARKKRAQKVKRRGHVRKGEAEHGIVRSGEDGWIGICFSKSASRPQLQEQQAEGVQCARWILIENVEADLRS
ncbi:hypothetical protein ACQY0O_003789 [Thecaphora frezii]